MQCDFLDYTGGMFSGGYTCTKEDKRVDRNTINTYCDNSLNYRNCPIYNKSSGGGCYLTTAVCDILGYEDDCYILNSLRDFRDNHMKKEESCKPLLDDYETVGPLVSESMHNDKHKEAVAKVMMRSCIKPAVMMIESGYYDDAIEVYKEMTLGLVEYYGIDKSLLSSHKVNGVNIQRKRELETV